jgi:Na+-translocating ferredoxin:NAD+ oxidoreductase RnfC subunit
MRLLPLDILSEDKLAWTKSCISCGACEYICPSAIPLLRLIDRKRGKTED